jgi:hypothetical protein
MLAQALTQIVGRANVEMTGHSNRFENVNVVHGRRGWSAFWSLTRPFGATLSPLGSVLFRAWRKLGLPRCSPRGTSGRKRVNGIESSFSDSKTPESICARTAKLDANRHLAALKFFMSGERTTSSFGDSATNRRGSLTR